MSVDRADIFKKKFDISTNLHSIDSHIQITFELENCNKLPFLSKHFVHRWLLISPPLGQFLNFNWKINSSFDAIQVWRQFSISAKEEN